jgi:hypothetical protein
MNINNAGGKKKQKHMLFPNHRTTIAFLICDKPRQHPPVLVA